LEDVNTLTSIISNFKKLGGKVPPAVEAALEVAKSAKNAEDSMNIACDGLFRFYVEENVRCAKEAGFSNLDQYYAARASDFSSDPVRKHEACILNVERKWQWTNIDYTVNPLNPDSALRQFLAKTAEQVSAITSKYIKKRLLKEANKDKSPI
jgi:hypothetical protein